MQGMATSGGYYVATPADRIVADRSCVTGSIGVIASMFNVEKLLKDWGVAPEVVKSGPMKDSGSPFRAMTDVERRRWEDLIQKMFDQFLGVILTHRADKVGGPEKLKQLADGRVYLAAEAKDFGLVDSIGYEQDAIEIAKDLAGLSGKSVRIVTFSRPFSGLLDLLMGSSARAQPLDPNRLLDRAFPRVYLLPQ
jgi:protease-4